MPCTQPPATHLELPAFHHEQFACSQARVALLDKDFACYDSALIHLRHNLALESGVELGEQEKACQSLLHGAAQGRAENGCCTLRV